MSTPSYNRLFESSLQSYYPSKTLDTLIRQYLEKTTHEAAMANGSPPTPPPAPLLTSDSANLLNELGDYFTRTANMWSNLTENLIQGPHIDRVSMDAHERCKQETLLSDLSALTAMEAKLSRLRKIRDLTVRFSHDVEAAWNPDGSQSLPASSSPTAASAFMEGRAPLPPSMAASNEIQGKASRWPANESAPAEQALQTMSFSEPEGSDNNDPDDEDEGGDGDDDDDDDDDDDADEEIFANIDMEALKQRGKGSHYCPKAFKCDKGGVDKDGNLVRFARNSSFMQHCNKHRKPWRCTKPGCPNPPKKRRFARKDGLDRHVQTVRHIVVEGQI